MSQSLNWGVECTSQAKICKLQNRVVLNKQVLWLQISVKNSVRVTEANTLQQLVHHALDNSCIDSVVSKLLHVLLQILFKELKHQIELLVCVDDLVKSGKQTCG